MHWVLKRGSFIWCGCSGETQCFDINYVIKFSHTADRNIIGSKRSLLCTPGCQACSGAWEHVSAYSLSSSETPALYWGLRWTLVIYFTHLQGQHRPLSSSWERLLNVSLTFKRVCYWNRVEDKIEKMCAIYPAKKWQSLVLKADRWLSGFVKQRFLLMRIKYSALCSHHCWVSIRYVSPSDDW